MVNKVYEAINGLAYPLGRHKQFIVGETLYYLFKTSYIDLFLQFRKIYSLKGY